MRFLLPWPYHGLWPNHRPSPFAKARATKAYRFHTAALARQAKASPGPIRVTFCPMPKGPKPDMDNCIAAFKAGQDGLADAMKVNDRHLSITYAMGERCRDGGIIVEISASETEPMR